MLPKPLQIPVTQRGKIQNACSLFLLAASWAIALYGYLTLPGIIPQYVFYRSGVTYGSRLAGYTDKWFIFTVPFSASLLYGVITLLGRYPDYLSYMEEVTPENAMQKYATTAWLMRWLKMVSMLFFTAMTTDMFLTTLGYNSHFEMMTISLPVLILVVPFIILLFRPSGNTTTSM